MGKETAPEFINLLRNIRDVIYPDMVRIDSNVNRVVLSTGTNVDTLIVVGEYEVDTNLPFLSVLGKLETKGFVLENIVQAKITQKFTDEATGAVSERVSESGLGLDWTDWVKSPMTLRIEALEAA